MFKLNEILTFEYESAYDFAYDLQMKKNYSNPKIYIANGDLKKRWYVYFSYRNQKTGRLKRVTPFYGDAHKYKTKEDRLFVLSVYRKKILELLKLGYNPFEDNQELYQKQKNKKSEQPVKTTVETKQEITPIAEPAPKIIKPTGKTIAEAFEFALSIKKNVVGERTYEGYISRLKSLKKYLDDNYPVIKYAEQLTKSIIVQYLNAVLLKTSARSRNNTRIALSSLFQMLEDNEIIPTNFIKNIPVLKAIPERNKTYTKEIQEQIFEYLEKKDPILLLYIKFISYNFLRPIEVNRLKVGDINLEEKTISFKAKNSPLKTKIIPDILIQDLPDLTGLKKENPLFTPDKFGGEWTTSEKNKRDYFSKRFKRVVKEHFNLGKDHGLYSFRHTYITKLYRKLAENSSPFEAKSKLMFITGHSTMVALEKYLRDIDAELPEDYSKYLKTH
ncbi:site-specific integrase [Lutibacter sp. TH_r2]|uniref:tyrosine-type recombinase/integrase n=1 Tax=Lutibacter sp. TH_r2 TaxID=3082083 RepID=UPI002955450B|nr:site-specific integrase [Lutibacter sp. TH_r2]MDV7188442.1 site-specific integrase [Lutibacter sp. TH_r2]